MTKDELTTGTFVLAILLEDGISNEQVLARGVPILENCMTHKHWGEDIPMLDDEEMQEICMEYIKVKGKSSGNK